MKEFITEFLSWSKGERIGVILLLALLIAGVVLYYIPNFQEHPIKFDITPYSIQLDSLDKMKKFVRARRYNRTPVVAFPFDPNKIGEDSMKLLGIPHWIAKRMIKYRNNGGRFRKKEDLKKIYGFRKEDYDRLEEYIILPLREPYKPSSKTIFKKNYQIPQAFGRLC